MIGTLLASNPLTISGQIDKTGRSTNVTIPTKSRKASTSNLTSNSLSGSNGSISFNSFGTVNDEWTEAGFLGKSFSTIIKGDNS